MKLLRQNQLFSTGISGLTDIDKCIETYSNSVLSAINTSTPKIINNCKTVNLSTHILDSIKKRNYFRQQWNRYHPRSDFLIYKEYDRLVKYEICCFRNSSWNDKVKSLDIRSKPFWNISKVLKKKITNMPHIADSNANEFLQNHQIANHIK